MFSQPYVSFPREGLIYMHNNKVKYLPPLTFGDYITFGGNMSQQATEPAESDVIIVNIN